MSFTPASIRPGDVVRVEIRNARLDSPVTATVFNQELSFEFDAGRASWRALVGVDLETAPGSYRLTIQRSDTDVPSMRTIQIVPRQFRVRRLRVAPEFVDPPPETLEQIKLDSKALAEAYARVTPKLWKGAFVRPVEAKTNSNFGTRSFYNGEPRAPHAGVDFLAQTGTPIRASNRGTIALASPLYFTGNTVVIDHGAKLFSIFAHLSEFNVAQGDTVEPETIVGLVGQTGRVTGPHLHWSVRLNGARVDPLSLMAATAE
jgi:murein DD-endopeptidase MepM/ murein hydrolase activator NlpD